MPNEDGANDERARHASTERLKIVHDKVKKEVADRLKDKGFDHHDIAGLLVVVAFEVFNESEGPTRALAYLRDAAADIERELREEQTS